MKKLFALALAIMMILSLAIPAAADDAEVVPLTDQNVDVQTEGHSYNIYQIFKGTQTAEDATLTDIEWGTGVKAADLLAALKNHETLKTYFSASNTAKDVAGVLAANNSSETVANAFANVAAKHLADPVKNGETTIVVDNSTTVLDLDAGYYLFKDVTDEDDLGTDHVRNPALLQVTKAGQITIRKKATVPYIEKANDDGTKAGVQKIQAMIGSTKPFKLTASLASGMAHYDTYPYIIHDDIPVGMSVVENSVKVYLMIDGDFDTKTEVTAGYTVNYAPDSSCGVFEPTAVTEDLADIATVGYSDDTCNLEIVFSDLIQNITIKDGTGTKEYRVDANDKFFVTYNAVVEPDAEQWMLEHAVFLHNDALVEFPNDPNWNGPNQPTGITPESDAEVYMTEVTVEKVDESKKALTGATFKLEGKGIHPVVTYGKHFVEQTEFAEGEAKYWKLTDDTYTTTDPKDLTDTSKYVDTTKTYALVDFEITNTDGTSERDGYVSITTTMGDDGRVSFGGLGAGTYYLTEVIAPAGYNLIKEPIKLVINFSNESHTFTYDWRHEGAENALSSTALVQVVNNAGHVLPETGGMGTTMFYVFGSVLVLAAVVLLITKKRMSAEN